MSTPGEGNYCFTAEWFDSQASMVRKYQLFYFLADNTLELFDLKNHRTFLKRCSYPSVTVSDLYIGAQVTIYARQLKIVGYGNCYNLVNWSGLNLALDYFLSDCLHGCMLTALLVLSQNVCFLRR